MKNKLLFLNEGGHEAVAIAMRITASLHTILVQNNIILMGLKIFNRVAGMSCSEKEVADRHAMSLPCLSLLALPDHVNAIAIDFALDAQAEKDLRDEGSRMGSYVVSVRYPLTT